MICEINAPIVETKFLELAMSLLDFSPRIPLGTFSILLLILKVSGHLKSKTLMMVYMSVQTFGERYCPKLHIFYWKLSFELNKFL